MGRSTVRPSSIPRTVGYSFKFTEKDSTNIHAVRLSFKSATRTLGPYHDRTPVCIGQRNYLQGCNVEVLENSVDNWKFIVQFFR